MTVMMGCHAGVVGMRSGSALDGHAKLRDVPPGVVVKFPDATTPARMIRFVPVAERRSTGTDAVHVPDAIVPSWLRNVAATVDDPHSPMAVTSTSRSGSWSGPTLGRPRW